MEDIESVLLVCREVSVYRLPPRQSNRGYRAADWGLDKPVWTCRLRVTAKGDKCVVALQDSSSGELFAQCPVDTHPGRAVEPVTDSSRYFVLRVDDGSGKHAFLGMGFQERGDAFDFNVALQDHFKREKQQAADHKAEDSKYVPKQDLTLKEGQTFRLNIKKKTSEEDPEEDVAPARKAAASMVSLTSSAGAFTSGKLQAPPGGLYRNPVAAAANPFGQPATSIPASLSGWGDTAATDNPFGDPSAAKSSAKDDDWGDFASE